MARAVVSSPTYSPNDDGILLTVTVLFYGRDLARPDHTTITVPLGAATTKAQARDAIRVALAAEATRLGYTYNGVATLLEELLVGL